MNKIFILIILILGFIFISRKKSIENMARIGVPEINVGAIAKNIDIDTGAIAKNIDIDTGAIAKNIDIDTGAIAKNIDIDTGAIAKNIDIDTGAIAKNVDIGGAAKRVDVDVDVGGAAKRIDAPKPKITAKTKQVAKAITKNWKGILAAAAVGYLGYNQYLSEEYQEEFKEYQNNLKKYFDNLELLEQCVESQNEAGFDECIKLKIDEENFPAEEGLADKAIMNEFYQNMKPYIDCLISKLIKPSECKYDATILNDPPLPPDKPNNPLTEIPIVGGLFEALDNTLNFGRDLTTNILKYGPYVVYGIIFIVILIVIWRIYSFISMVSPSRNQSYPRNFNQPMIFNRPMPMQMPIPMSMPVSPQMPMPMQAQMPMPMQQMPMPMQQMPKKPQMPPPPK